MIIYIIIIFDISNKICIKNSNISIWKHFFEKITRVISQFEFDQVITDICNINSQVIKWLFEYISMKYWVELYFKEYHYNHFISNITKSLNSWILEAHKKSILTIFENIYHQLMIWFNIYHILKNKMIELLIIKIIEYL